MFGIKDRPLAVIILLVFNTYLCPDLHPLFCLVILRFRPFAHKAQKRHIRLTACHGHAARHKLALGEFRSFKNHGREFHHLVLIALRLVHAVNIPNAVILRLNFNHIRAKVIGKILLQGSLFDFPFLVLQDNLAFPAHGPYGPAVRGQLVIPNPVAPVHDNQLRSPQHGPQKRLHVLHIEFKGRTVNNGNLLINGPVIRQF